jgi:hypothetical protein
MAEISEKSITSNVVCSLVKWVECKRCLQKSRVNNECIFIFITLLILQVKDLNITKKIQNSGKVVPNI